MFLFLAVGGPQEGHALDQSTCARASLDSGTCMNKIAWIILSWYQRVYSCLHSVYFFCHFSRVAGIRSGVEYHSLRIMASLRSCTSRSHSAIEWRGPRSSIGFVAPGIRCSRISSRSSGAFLSMWLPVQVFSPTKCSCAPIASRPLRKSLYAFWAQVLRSGWLICQRSSAVGPFGWGFSVVRKRTCASYFG